MHADIYYENELPARAQNLLGPNFTLLRIGQEPESPTSDANKGSATDVPMDCRFCNRSSKGQERQAYYRTPDQMRDPRANLANRPF
jgi:hypothetical protein